MNDNRDTFDYELTLTTHEVTAVATHIKTKELRYRDPIEVAEPKQDNNIVHNLPWRISFCISSLQVELIFELVDTLIVGRSDPNTPSFRGLDLFPFNGFEMGVSRHHAKLASIDEQIVLMDNSSSNGTLLNQEKLRAGEAYPIHHGDQIQLGGMEIKVYFLTNPFTPV